MHGLRRVLARAEPMIEPYRFISSKLLDEQGWLTARESAVTATMVSSAATKSGFTEVTAQIDNPTPIEQNAYMSFGLDNEAWLSMFLLREYGVLPNDWLIQSDQSNGGLPFEMATPDGLWMSDGSNTIAEIKTTGTDWGDVSKIPIKYRRQVQWQLYCCDADKCVFAWLLRTTDSDGRFVPAWFEPKVGIIERDEKIIAELRDVAERLEMHRVYRSRERG